MNEQMNFAWEQIQMKVDIYRNERDTNDRIQKFT